MIVVSVSNQIPQNLQAVYFHMPYNLFGIPAGINNVGILILRADDITVCDTSAQIQALDTDIRRLR